MSNIESATTPVEENPEDKDQTPRKRKSRGSYAQKANEESQALLKEMGFDDNETSGGRRRTRASTRGEVYTPPPKRQRRSAGSTPPSSGRRGRRKLEETPQKEEPMEVNEPEIVKDDKVSTQKEVTDVQETEPAEEDKTVDLVQEIKQTEDKPVITTPKVILSKLAAAKENIEESTETKKIIEEPPKVDNPVESVHSKITITSPNKSEEKLIPAKPVVNATTNDNISDNGVEDKSLETIEMENDSIDKISEGNAKPVPIPIPVTTNPVVQSQSNGSFHI